MSDEEKDTAPTKPTKPTTPTTPPSATAQTGGLYSVAPSLAKSPLGIIALFILLVYAISGIVCATWKPPVPEALVWFIVLFPVLVFGVFTWLVVHHHQKLYAPGDFTDQTHWIRLQEIERERELARSGALRPVNLPGAERAAASAASEVPRMELRERGIDETASGDRLGTRVIDSMSDPADPNKGRFGGRPEVGPWQLSIVRNAVRNMKKNKDLFELTLQVSGSAEPVKDPVKIFLHPSFGPQPVIVRPAEGTVLLPLISYGAFTVGAEMNDGTRLELDLAAPAINAPDAFREH